MTKYLVQKRATLGANWTAFAGDVVEDPPGVDILLSRGFLTPAPSDYPGPVNRPTTVTTVAAPATATETQPAVPEGEVDSLSYPELQARAKALGINARQKRPALEAAVAAAEKVAAVEAAEEPSTARSRLEEMTDEQLVTVAHEYGVEVASRDETIAAILAKAGYKEDASASGESGEG